MLGLQIVGMGDWYLVNVDANRTLSITPRTLGPAMINDSMITADLVGDDSGQKVVYFGAPDHYLGEISLIVRVLRSIFKCQFAFQTTTFKFLSL